MECAAGLHAPDILAIFERVSSIYVCCLRGIVPGEIYLSKDFCGKHTFFAPEYIFSPTDNFVAARRCHQPGKTTKSNFQ